MISYHIINGKKIKAYYRGKAKKSLLMNHTLSLYETWIT